MAFKNILACPPLSVTFHKEFPVINQSEFLGFGVLNQPQITT